MDLLDLQHVLDRFHPGYAKRISCAEGWFFLVFECDRELAEIDPDYQILQVKEKFGGLRFYFSSDKPELLDEMNAVVADFEEFSYHVCEMTGKPGVLMKKNRWYKTLDPGLGDAAGYVLA